MKFQRTLLFSVLLLTLSIPVISDIIKIPKCMYIIFVKTGGPGDAGTNSKISARLRTTSGQIVRISNLVAWGGQREYQYEILYFEPYTLDMFIGEGICLSSWICELILESDGSGAPNWASWYPEFVDIIYSELDTQCQRKRFTIQQWLSLDHEPFSLIAVRNECTDMITSTTNTTGTLAHPV